GPRQLCLRFVPRRSATATATLAVAAHHGYRMLERTLERSPYIDTTGEWGRYVAGLDGKLRRELRRRRRKLDERGRVELTVCDGREDLDRLLAECLRVEALGAKRRRTAIASDASATAFYRDVARWAADRGILRVARLRLEGRPVAVDLALEDGGHHYLLKTGYDPALRTLAPGLLLRAEMVERAFATGLRRYHFLGADEPWKLEWTRTTQELLDLRAFRPTPTGLAGWSISAGLRPLAVRALERMGR
ncbi:MAG TPA: GNAT family N-acetyltransferase, partial [Acidimicrobiales bacterium]